MPVRMKAKTSPTGYIAEIEHEDKYLAELPVARFDDDGFALVCNPATGRLMRAVDFPGYLSVTPMWIPGR